MTKSMILAAVLSLGTATAASAVVGSFNLPNLTWPDPVETPTQNCADPTTVSGPACTPAGS